MFAYKPFLYRCFNRPGLITLLFSIFVLEACDGSSKTEEHIDQVANQISRGIISTTNELQELLPSSSELEKTSSEEIEKTFAIEYKAVEIKSDTSTEDLQKILSNLGKDRWDCFALSPGIMSGHLLCKRRPHSALRTILGVGGIH